MKPPWLAALACGLRPDSGCRGWLATLALEQHGHELTGRSARTFLGAIGTGTRRRALKRRQIPVRT